MSTSYGHLYLPEVAPKRCVIKIGSSLLTSQNSPALNVRRMSNLVRQIAVLIEHGWQVVLVSSGAVAGGMSVLGLNARPKSIPLLQACASVGQVELMKKYARLFHARGLTCAQILLTAEDLRSRSRYINAKNTMNELIERRIVPVVNENDTVSTEEIAFGDNDRLSALVAGACDAKILVILSDVEGLYSDVASRKVVPVVEKIDAGIRSMVSTKRKGKTTVGGMATKLDAASIASKWGIYTIVANGHARDILVDLLVRRIHRGTLFLPASRRIDSRRMWIAYIARPKGRLIVDTGAKDAISLRGKSLLTAGVKEVMGQFDRGDVVEIFCGDEEVGRGIAGMSSEEMMRFIGKRAGREAIHRDNMVIWSEEG